MDADLASLPDDVEALKRALLAARAEAAVARAERSDDKALIVHLKLQIDKLRRELYGNHSERSARLLSQLELQLEDIEASATEDELAAEMAAAKTEAVSGFTRQRPARKPFPEHLRASASLSLARRAAPAVAAQSSPSWARILPRLSRWSRGDGR